MFSKSKTQPTSLADVFGGVLIGILGCYLFLYAPDIWQGRHVPDLRLLSQLLLLGALVLGFGYWRSTRKG